MKTNSAVGWMVAVLLLGGCAHRVKTATKTDVNAPYKIGREDVLDVSVWRDPDLTRTVAVRPDGFISMPIAGEIQAEGKTSIELASVIKERLGAYVQDPKVTVIVREANSSRVYITGEVARPGAFPLRGRLTVVQAVALAGGFTAFANSDGILVMRKDGQIPVRYSDVLEAESQDAEVWLQPGDTVVVP